MFVFLALLILYPNDRPTGFVMATKTCRAAKYKLYQRPLNLMRSLSENRPLKVSILGDKRLVQKKCRQHYIIIDTTTDHITPCCACAYVQGNKESIRNIRDQSRRQLECWRRCKQET